MARYRTAMARVIRSGAKRRGTDESEVRARIVRAASVIINEEGFAAITAPRLADTIGLRRPIIYYYFDDMDEIRKAAVRFAYGETKAAALLTLPYKNPVDVLWRIFEKTSAPLSELTTYSLRDESYRPLLAEIMEDLRRTFISPIEAQVAERPHTAILGPAGMAFLVQAVSTALATERRLGLDLGHSTVRQFFASALGVTAAIDG
jgi:AcrR family transcriptional regulator